MLQLRNGLGLFFGLYIGIKTKQIISIFDDNPVIYRFSDEKFPYLLYPCKLDDEMYTQKILKELTGKGDRPIWIHKSINLKDSIDDNSCNTEKNENSHIFK